MHLSNRSFMRVAADAALRLALTWPSAVWLIAALAFCVPSALGSGTRPETVKSKLQPGEKKSFRMNRVDTALAFRNTTASIGYKRFGTERRPDRLPDLSGKKYLAKYRKGGARIVARSSPQTDVLKIRCVNRGDKPRDFRFTYIHRHPRNGDASPNGDGTPNRA
jgi:hypothetical protein